LSITAATITNAGNYSLVVTNAYGSVTSSIAALTVLVAPGFSAQPANLTILAGGDATFSATASGSAPLVYQWQENGTNLVNGSGVYGANTSALTLAGVTTNCTANYTLVVANALGSATCAVATLTVVLPPLIDGPLTNQTVEYGGNATFTIAASGTPPLSYQWSLDGTPIFGAASNSVTLVNIQLPNHTVSVTITNPYASATDTATLTVVNTNPPVTTLIAAPVITGVVASPDGSFTLSLAGTIGDTYVLETATNFFATGGWQPVATNTLETNAVWQFNDTGATNFAQRFYRLMLVPGPASQSKVAKPSKPSKPSLQKNNSNQDS
jgi:hypothetical protein